MKLEIIIRKTHLIIFDFENGKTSCTFLGERCYTVMNAQGGINNSQSVETFSVMLNYFRRRSPTVAFGLFTTMCDNCDIHQ